MCGVRGNNTKNVAVVTAMQRRQVQDVVSARQQVTSSLVLLYFSVLSYKKWHKTFKNVKFR
jgi:hypothetical protein